MAKTTKKTAKKAVRKKVVYKETDSDLIQTIQQFDPTKIETGYYFVADIDGKKNVKGRILKETDYQFFLCQDVVGNEGSNLGYKYNWGADDLRDLSNFEVSNLRIYKEKPDGWKVPEIPLIINTDGDDNEVEFYKGYIEVGCSKITNAIVREIASKLKD